MTLLNRSLKAYQRWIDRLRFGKQERVACFCIRRVLGNGEEIKYQMRYDPEAIRRIQQATNTTEQ